MNARISGCRSGHPSKRGSSRMSGTRQDSVSSRVAPSRPWVRGRSPIMAARASLMPEVRNFAKPPRPSGTPSAAYRARPSSRAAWTSFCRMASTDSSPTIPSTASLMASNAAPSRPAREAPRSGMALPTSRVVPRMKPGPSIGRPPAPWHPPGDRARFRPRTDHGGGGGDYGGHDAQDLDQAGEETVHELVRAAALDDIPDGGTKLFRHYDKRIALFRTRKGVFAVDNRCPHEGYALVRGEVKGDVLTCEWHNWKFRLADGACLFGGENVRSYPVEIRGSQVFVDVTDPAAEEIAPQLFASLLDAMGEMDVGRLARDAVRLQGIGTPLAELVREGVHYGAPRAEPGAVRHALLEALTDHCLGYGHPMIYCQKSFELLGRIGWGEAPSVLG